MLKYFKLCWSLGGALAEFKDKAEESHVSSFLDIDRHFWIGLDDLAHEGFQKKKSTRPGLDKVKPKGWFKYSLQIE